MESNLASAPRVGRPKDMAKSAAIIVAARGLFAREPFDSVTMEAVAALAGVSKMTVYSHFHDKDALFETVVRVISGDMIAGLASPDDVEGCVFERLTVIGRRFLSLIFGLDSAQMSHTLAGALRGNQELAHRFYDAGPGRVKAAIAEIILAASACGELVIDEPAAAAEDLISLWEGSLPTQIAFGLTGTVTAEEIERRAARGTEVFRRAYASKPYEKPSGKS